MSNKKSFSMNLTGLVISNEKLEIGNLSINLDKDSDLADVVNHYHDHEEHHHTGESQAAVEKGRLDEKKLDAELISKILPLGLTLIQSVIKANADDNVQRHNLRMQEMQEKDRLEAEKHRRIQEAKGQPTVGEIVKAISESNGELVEELVKKVRGY